MDSWVYRDFVVHKVLGGCFVLEPHFKHDIGFAVCPMIWLARQTQSFLRGTTLYTIYTDSLSFPMTFFFPYTDTALFLPLHSTGLFFSHTAQSSPPQCTALLDISLLTHDSSQTLSLLKHFSARSLPYFALPFKSNTSLPSQTLQCAD